MDMRRTLLRTSASKRRLSGSFIYRTATRSNPNFKYHYRSKIQANRFSTIATTMLPYPTRSEITALFKNMETGDYATLFKRVSSDVNWTVMGTHPLAGLYNSLQDFNEATAARLNKIMKEPIKLMVRNVIGGGEGDWATVELVVKAECVDGELHSSD